MADVLNKNYQINNSGEVETQITSALWGTASFARTASYALNGGGSTLTTGSTYPITSSQAVSASYARSASWAPSGGGTSLTTGSTYPITSSWAVNVVNAPAATLTGSVHIGPGATEKLVFYTFDSWMETDEAGGINFKLDGGNVTVQLGNNGQFFGAGLNGTASWANNARTASYSQTALSADYAVYASNISSSAKITGSTMRLNVGETNYMSVTNETLNGLGTLPYITFKDANDVGLGGMTNLFCFDKTYATDANVYITSRDYGTTSRGLQITYETPNSMSVFRGLGGAHVSVGSDSDTGYTKIVAGSTDIITARGSKVDIAKNTNITGSLNVLGQTYISNLEGTGSLLGTASWARPKTTVASSSYATLFQTNGIVSDHHRVLLTGNITLAKATASYDGQRLSWEFIQDNTGTRTMTLDAAYLTGSDLQVQLLGSSSKRDFMTSIYNQSTDKWYVIGFLRGY